MLLSGRVVLMSCSSSSVLICHLSIVIFGLALGGANPRPFRWAISFVGSTGEPGLPGFQADVEAFSLKRTPPGWSSSAKNGIGASVRRDSLVWFILGTAFSTRSSPRVVC